MPDLFDYIRELIDAGGYVMPPLMVATLILWYALGKRISLLRRGSKQSVRDLILQHRNRAGDSRTHGIIDFAVIRGLDLAKTKPLYLRRYLDDCFNDIYYRLHNYARIIRSIVIVAPLAGLLGTVSGMIETFDSLGDMVLFTQNGGIAGGISQALFSTQMGLSIAIPGLILDRILHKKQNVLQRELAQIKDILCSHDYDYQSATGVC